VPFPKPCAAAFQLAESLPHRFSAVDAGEDKPVYSRRLLSALSNGLKDRGWRISMNGNLDYMRAMLRNSADSTLAWCRARPTSTRTPESRRRFIRLPSWWMIPGLVLA